MAETQPILATNMVSGSFLQYHIKSQLLGMIRTGDPLYDTIVAFVILTVQEWATRYIGDLKNVIVSIITTIYGWARSCWFYLYRKNIVMIEKYAEIKHITDGREVNTVFEPVLWYLNSLTDTRSEKKVFVETTKTRPELCIQIPKKRTAIINFAGHKIKYNISTEIITIYADKEHKRENMIISLETVTEENRDVDIFKEFIETCQKKYRQFISKMVWVQHIYRNEDDQWKKKVGKSSRKLETVILKDGQMENITKDINEFITQEEWYVSRDIPYTRRYMFWGPPGTGKSSCVKALACHTKRDIHYLVLSEVKSDKQLFKLFEGIEFEKTILVIEDIDCATDITSARSVGENDLQTDVSSEKTAENTLTLSGLLNAIDGGIVENHGQIMVMTTNHPQKLDPALVRPGRVDQSYEFGCCNDQQILGLFYNFFQVYPSNTYSFPENISPAKITNILLQYKRDPDQAWAMLIKEFGKK